MRSSLWVFVITATMATAVARNDGPWRGAGAEWLFVQSEVQESWPGIYHDRVSGACIRMEVQGSREGTDAGSPLAVPRDGDEDVRTGVSAGVPYRVKVGSHPSCPQGRRIEVTFMPKGSNATWSTRAETCGDEQFRRVQEFYFGSGRGPATERRPNEEARRLKQGEVDALPMGMSFEEVRARFGEPAQGACGPEDGFTAEWTEDTQTAWVQRTLRFDHERKLIRTR
jgi:hypothetical protein